MAEEIYVGNVTTGAADRGWLLGHFMPPGDARRSDAVEIKWGVHPAGEQRRGWVTDDARSILSVLVSGRFRIDLPDRSVVLAKQGDYIVFHGASHTWQAEEEWVVLSVRWPSLPGYDQVSQERGPSPMRH
ncbi:MAG: signal peptidase I [Trebonia sp.]